MDMFKSEFEDFQKQFVRQEQFHLTAGKFGTVAVYKHEPTQKDLLVKYVKSKNFNPIEPYVHYLMKENKYFVKLFYSINWLSGHLLIMDYIKNGDLFDLVTARKLTEDEVKMIASQVADGVNALHSFNLIHNDIKLENILCCNKRLQIKICDYGLCQHIGQKSVLNGTLDYFSPEKLKHANYDVHFDWWALAILIFELLTKQNHPYKIDNKEELTLTKLRQRQEEKINFNYSMSFAAKSLLSGMLKLNLNYRLSSYTLIKQHVFFKIY
ncbi:pk-1 [Sucra jujuba nucleopolyhedrovirus]|uniref:non-specific serine/threonine protein kinase n=1 Tax=Sucra jujuba nucleopolyhedrovirus TaxID=1563660 RepID=A0A097P8T5_9ABAC|nr:pk-1 [Sucra jujuba nucleopolyhedrovirus]AIU41242.1 pk-1 [Sucra jujuba nucleopolyhedrovirus]